jgi:hypothetical protein
MSIGSILAFNVLIVRTWIPASHGASSLTVLASGAKSLIISIPRSFLFGWHGSVTATFPRIAFPVCMLLAAICLCSLRPHQQVGGLESTGHMSRMLGAPACVRSYDPSARLRGYGLIALVMGFRPMKWANGVWMLYALVSFVFGVVNGIFVNSLGSDDPRCAELAAEFRSYYIGSEIVATNSFHILNIHANIPSIPVNDYAEADHYHKFFWVTLPQFDAIATSVTGMPHPGKEWCEDTSFSGGVLFTRCIGSIGP